MSIERSGRRFAARRLRALTEELLEASTLCAIATVGRRDEAHVNTAYFAWAQDLRIVWLSEPRARHSRNLRVHASAAIAVYDSAQTWGRPDRGIQLSGTARHGSADAEAVYARRFPEYRKGRFTSYRFYELVPRRVKLFDEERLGAATFVTARVGRGGEIAWERTEVYRAER